VNSCTISGEKLTTARARPTPVLLTPSARIAVLPGRPPFRLRLKPGTVAPEVTVGSSLPASPVTLGITTARSSTLRLFRGRSTICRSVIVWPVVPDSVSISGASAVTVTSACNPPGSSLTSTVEVVAVSTFTRSTTAFLKPDSSTVTRYSTGSSAVAAYVPAADVTRSNVWFVPRFVTVTVAPGTTAPEVSRTVPDMPPRFVCASRGAAQTSTTPRARQARAKGIAAPWLGFGMMSNLRLPQGKGQGGGRGPATFRMTKRRRHEEVGQDPRIRAPRAIQSSTSHNHCGSLISVWAPRPPGVTSPA
jgi:hypothetical protein